MVATTCPDVVKPQGDRAARRRELEERLETGFQLIDHRRDAGQDVERWEQRWLRLLREYERLCEEIAAA